MTKGPDGAGQSDGLHRGRRRRRRLIAAAVAAGLRIVHPLSDEEWGVRRFFFADASGNVVNVLSPPALGLQRAGGHRRPR